MLSTLLGVTFVLACDFREFLKVKFCNPRSLYRQNRPLSSIVIRKRVSSSPRSSPEGVALSSLCNECRSTHLVAVAAIVAAVTVAGCLGLPATKRKKTAFEVQKQLSPKKTNGFFFFPHVSELALNLISNDSSPKNAGFFLEGTFWGDRP